MINYAFPDVKLLSNLFYLELGWEFHYFFFIYIRSYTVIHILQHAHFVFSDLTTSWLPLLLLAFRHPILCQHLLPEVVFYGCDIQILQTAVQNGLQKYLEKNPLPLIFFLVWYAIAKKANKEKQSFGTSMKTDLHYLRKDINRGFAFSKCLNAKP